MKKSILRLAMGLGLIMSTAAIEAQKCQRHEETTVDIELGNNSLTYPTSEEVSGPSVCRGNAFTIRVTWTDNTVDRLRLNSFRPVLSRTKRVENMNNTELVNGPTLFPHKPLGD